MADQPMLGRMPSWQNATSDGTAVAFSHSGTEDGTGGGGSGGGSGGGQGVSGETVLGGDSIDVTENPDGSVTIDYNPDKPGENELDDCNDWSGGGGNPYRNPSGETDEWNDWSQEEIGWGYGELEDDYGSGGWGGDSCKELNGWGDED